MIKITSFKSVCCKKKLKKEKKKTVKNKLIILNLISYYKGMIKYHMIFYEQF